MLEVAGDFRTMSPTQQDDPRVTASTRPAAPRPAWCPGPGGRVDTGPPPGPDRPSAATPTGTGKSRAYPTAQGGAGEARSEHKMNS